jgi:hypothetical protein
MPSPSLLERAEAVIRTRFADAQITLWGTDELTAEQQTHVRAKPRPYLLSAIELLDALESPNIVEVGCMRQPMRHALDEFDPVCCNDGHSTLFWASTGHPVWSVDIDMRACQLAASYLQDYPNATVVCGDGIKFLRKFERPIGLLYLDGWDVIPGTDYAEQHLAAYQAARPHFAATSLILIDDTDLLMGGKGKLVLPAAIRDGYELLALGRQTMLLRAG